MLVFVTCLMHPANAKSYATIGRLLARTLRSLCAQTSDAFEVVLVCNQVPPGIEPHPKVHFVTVEHPPCEGQGERAAGLRASNVDRGCKRAIGVVYARRFDPDYIMLCDADDLVSNRLAAYVEQHAGGPGWFVERGHIHREGSVVSFLKRGFHQVCGSSNILRTDLLELPAELSVDANQDDILAAVDLAYLVQIFGGHSFAVDRYGDRGLPLAPLPFPGAVWILGTGENTSGIRNAGAAWTPIGDDLRREFGFDVDAGNQVHFTLRLLRGWLWSVYVMVREAAFAVIRRA